MGREIKRVPLDFDWPLGEVWGGFIMPDSLRGEPCPNCRGSGQTAAGWWLQRFAQRLEMLADDLIDQQRGKPMHPWLAEDRYPYTAPIDPSDLRLGYEIVRPSPDMVDLIKGLGGGRFQHHRIYQAIANAAGLPNFGGCETCDGEGSTEKYPGQRDEAENWTGTEPPEGEGWQLWETVSDGSPISSVFATAKELSAWMQTPAYTWGASSPLTKEQADRFVTVGSAPSLISVDGQPPVPGEQMV